MLSCLKPTAIRRVQTIDAYDYVDLFSYAVTDYATVTFGADNLFNDDPPALGNEIGATRANSGNISLVSTTPWVPYKAGLRFKF